MGRRVLRLTPRYLSRYRALGIVAGSELAKSIGRTLQALTETDLPREQDFVVAIPPTRSAFARRVPGENVWILFDWTETEVRVRHVATTPPVPID